MFSSINIYCKPTYFKRRVECHFSSKMKRKSRDWDLTLELSCHAGCPTVGRFYSIGMCIWNVGYLLPLRYALGMWVICCIWDVYWECGSYVAFEVCIWNLGHVAFEVCIWNVGHMLPFEPETSKVRYIMWYWYYTCTVWSQYFLIHLSYIYTTSTSITKIWKYKKKLLWNLMLCFDMKTMLCL